MSMTYDLPAEKIKARLDTILATGEGDFLPGDGFDKLDAPRLDAYLKGLGYRVAYCVTHGGGQFKRVYTACGLVVARNGYAHPILPDSVEARTARTARQALAARIAQLSPEDLAEYRATADKALWVEYTVLDFATPDGLSRRYLPLAEDMLDAALASA